MKMVLLKTLRKVLLVGGALVIWTTSGFAQAASNAQPSVGTSSSASDKDRAARDAKPSQSFNAAPADSDFVIGPEDVLGINVWREPEMSRSVPVRPDGRFHCRF